MQSGSPRSWHQDRLLRNLVNRLRTESAEFDAAWEKHEVKEMEAQTKRFLNERVGLIRLTHTKLWTGPSSEVRMTAYTPIDQDSHDKLVALRKLA